MTTVIAVLGDRDPAQLTHRELDSALDLLPAGVDARWVATDSPEAASIDAFDGLWVVPGTPYRDDDAALIAIEHARLNGMPILGTCGGFQYMLVEFARNVSGIAEAAYAETDPAAVGRLSRSSRAASSERSGVSRPFPERGLRHSAGTSLSRASTGVATGSTPAMSAVWRTPVSSSAPTPTTRVSKRSSYPTIRSTSRRSSNRRPAAPQAAGSTRSSTRSPRPAAGVGSDTDTEPGQRRAATYRVRPSRLPGRGSAPPLRGAGCTPARVGRAACRRALPRRRGRRRGRAPGRRRSRPRPGRA